METDQGNAYRNPDKSARPSSIRKKLVIIGDGGCGKKCLLVVYSKDKFPEIHVPTVFDIYVADIEVSGRLVELALWDTAGQEDYERLRPLSYPGTDVLLVCFSIVNPVSLLNVSEKWHPEVSHFCPDIPVILAGTKRDLRNDNQILLELEKDQQKPVSTEEGQQIAKSINAYTYIECSAKTGEGVQEVFEMAAKASLAKKRSHSFWACKLL